MPATQVAAALTVPEDLRPLVQQQLEAAATQRLAWHGEIWPRQFMDWEIERDARQGDDTTNAAPAWQTSLRLTLPRLGEIDARIRLTGQTVQLVLHTLNATSAADLDAAIPSLRQALTAAGLTLQGVETQHGTD
jgi:flagellar hook-length control protein FliK